MKGGEKRMIITSRDNNSLGEMLDNFVERNYPDCSDYALYSIDGEEGFVVADKNLEVKYSGCIVRLWTIGNLRHCEQYIKNAHISYDLN